MKSYETRYGIRGAVFGVAVDAGALGYEIEDEYIDFRIERTYLMGLSVFKGHLHFPEARRKLVCQTSALTSPLSCWRRAMPSKLSSPLRISSGDNSVKRAEHTAIAAFRMLNSPTMGTS